MTAHVTGDERETPAEQPRTVAALEQGDQPAAAADPPAAGRAGLVLR